jgi:Xaa-Pro aminopeptidase
MTTTPAHSAGSDEYWAGLRFTDAEYRERRTRLADYVGRLGAGVAVISDERVVWYLTGFGGSAPQGSAARPIICMLASDGSATVLPHASTAVTVREMVGEEVEVRPYRALGAPRDELTELLRPQAGDGIAVELGGQLAPRLSTADLIELEQRLGTSLIDASPAVWRARMVKSPAELDRLRRACALTSTAYDVGFAAVRAGDTERSIAARMAAELRSLGADGAWSTCVTGRGDYGRVDGVPRARAAESGDLVFVDMGANVGGYWADFSRAGVIGGPTAHHEQMQAAVRRATEAGVSALRSGATAADCAVACQTAMDTEGLVFNTVPSRFGHGLGMAVTEVPDVMETDQTVLEPGTVVTVEPGTYDDDGYYHCEENVVVTDGEPEVLSTSPWQLRTLG